MRTIMLTLGQAAGAFAALAGLYSLVGPEWVALTGGIALLGLCTLAEALPPRPRSAGPRPTAAQLADLPGATRSPRKD